MDKSLFQLSFAKENVKTNVITKQIEALYRSKVSCHIVGSKFNLHYQIEILSEKHQGTSQNMLPYVPNKLDWLATASNSPSKQYQAIGKHIKLSFIPSIPCSITAYTRCKSRFEKHTHRKF